MLARFPVPCGAESQNSCLCFLSSQHFVPLANVTAFKGAEKTREIYTVNHFCAETAEEGLSLAGKHRRLCAVAAKKLIYMCPPHSVFTAPPLSLGFHPRGLSWMKGPRRLCSLMLYLTGPNWTLWWKCSISQWIGVGLTLFVWKLQFQLRVCATQWLKMKALILYSFVATFCDWRDD